MNANMTGRAASLVGVSALLIGLGWGVPTASAAQSRFTNFAGAQFTDGRTSDNRCFRCNEPDQGFPPPGECVGSVQQQSTNE
jgi:hypothetical protein